MSDRRTTRRQVFGLGAAAFAAASLKSPASALAGRQALFELDLAMEPLTASAAGAGWRTTRVLRAPRRFDLIGLRWARGSRAEAQVRARRRGGRWTQWAALHEMGDHGPDGARAVAGTDPAFVGAADEFQLRLRGNPRALRARFVRALPAATVARRVGERLRRRARTSVRPRQVAGPSVRVITRSEWGGDSVPPRAAADYGTVEAAFVHHTVTTNDYAPEDSAGIVLGIARYHRDSNGWNDLGYNFLVDKYGQVFEGRAGGIDAPVIGAQAQGYNSVSTGVALLGTHTGVVASEPAMEALARLIGWKLALHGVPVQGQVTVTSAGGESNRYRAGTPVTLERISGHRDGDSTSCPGNLLYGQLADLRARAARYAAPSSTLTMYTSRTVRGVKPSEVGGELRFSDGSSPAGVPVDIEIQAGGAAWTYYTGAVAGADGSWITSVSLPYSARLRAVFPGDSRPRMESKAIAVKVVPSLKIATSGRPRRRRALKLTGTMSPPSPRVTVTFERRVGRRWRRVQRKRVAVTGGAFATIVRPPVPGRYRVSVSGGGITRRRRFRAR
ncbi:MAG TPA: peptidoglycan recognition protein [Solirubrobacteraceae bacterium]|nr:peptidoglycan recognition protein [Solirubrobacteraceae bacterium]